MNTSITDTIILPRTLINQLLSHAQHSPEDEVCGLISAKSGQPLHAYRIANVAGDKTHLFQMDPKAQIDTMREIREQGEELFAIYHSHPHAPAKPSREDIEQAAYPDAVYLIISLDTKGVLEMRGFKLQEGEVTEITLEMLN